MTALTRGLDRINRMICKLLRWLTIFLMAAITLNVFAGVFWRYVLNSSLPWYEEAGKYMMFWLVFVAAPIVLKNRGQIALDILPNLLPPRLRNLNYLIIYAVVFGLMCVFVWQGYSIAWIARKQQPSSFELSFFWIYFAIPFGSAIMALISLEFLLKALHGIFRPDAVDLEPGNMIDNSLT
ncbi:MULTISPECIES: TRAP transporter small permease [Marinovum]|uniref:TRAP transporter small permease n=1 Tax=Marinovum TaxID=367771 RepID=UPI00237A6C4F|nr:TRAP transporter small permease [Marinovum sp. PR37]MDD9742920.1 TRAP transporter small permease [Marinovum sp. PR37]